MTASESSISPLATQGVRFGKYLLLERVAVGGMAELYLAKSFGVEGFEKFIAIKRLLPTMVEDEEFVTMFIDEAKIAGQLNHANIVPIYELGCIDESHFIAMEFIWGKDVLQIINRFRRMRKRMPPVMAAWVASKICTGLAYAHSQRDREGQPLQLIHRDVSPQNIVVNYDGQVKLIDFGIAKAASRSAKTETGVLKGKFGYMSPEQVLGKEIDQRSDLFAVGTCMYEMLTCDRLFFRDSDLATLEMVSRAEVPELSRALPEVPEDLAAIVMRALRLDPAERFQTANEFQLTLQGFLKQEAQPFHAAKLAAWMRSAFRVEMAEERQRLDAYSKGSYLIGNLAPIVAEAGVAAEAAVADDTTPSEGVSGRQSSVPLPNEETSVTAATFASLVERDEDEDTVQANLPSLHELAAMEERVQAVGTAKLQVSSSASSAGVSIPARRSSATVRKTSELRATAAALHSLPPPDSAAGGRPPRRQEDATFRVGRQQAQRLSAPGRQPSRSPSRSPSVIALSTVLVLLLALGIVLGWLLWLRRSKGVIELRTSPPVAAAVRIDGMPRGSAPLRVEGLSAGEHLISLVAPGYETMTRRVTLQPGTTLMIELAITAQAKPASTVPVPQPVRDLPPAGPPRAELPQVEPPQAGSATQQAANVNSKRPASPAARRVSATKKVAAAGSGILVINTMPVSRIFIDGKDSGRSTPVLSLKVPAGARRIGLKTPDGQMHTVQVVVEDGRTLKIIRRL